MNDINVVNTLPIKYLAPSLENKDSTDTNVLSILPVILFIFEYVPSQFNNDPITLKIGESKKLEYDVAPSNVDLTRLTWFSSESRVATVDQNGEVTGKSLGEVLIRVSTFDGKSADIMVIVE